VPYLCDEDALSPSAHCIFHDQSYWKDNPSRVNERLIKKIETALPNKEVLYFIGYNLPEIKITEGFEAATYFDFTKFHDLAYFKSATFDLVSFEGARFEGSAVFQDATFRKADLSAVFQDATFRKADFKQATFNEEANFQRAIFGKHDFSESKFLGSLIFNEAIFGEA